MLRPNTTANTSTGTTTKIGGGGTVQAEDLRADAVLEDQHDEPEGRAHR